VKDFQKAKFHPSLVVPIVGDGALAGAAFADGRLLPVLILETSKRSDVSEVLRIHRFIPVGDAQFRWALSRDTDDGVALWMRFVRPIEVELLLQFSIERQAILVEGMLSGGGVWLQEGSPGDRLATTLEAERLAVELPDVGFRAEWDRFLLRRVTRVIAERAGLSRRKARPLAKETIENMRKMTSFRMPPSTPEDRFVSDQ
jgi:hypothetical protein